MRASAALAVYPLDAKGGYRILRCAELTTDFRTERPDVGAERVDQCAMAGEDITFGVCAFELASVDDQRLGVCVLQVFDGLDHRLDLRLHVVRLIDRQADAAFERRAARRARGR